MKREKLQKKDSLRYVYYAKVLVSFKDFEK